VTVEVPDDVQPIRSVNLTSVTEQGFYAEVLYDELEGVEKPEVFTFAIQAPTGNSGEFVIDTVNGEPIDKLKLDASQTGTENGLEHWRGQISIKKFIKNRILCIAYFKIRKFLL